MGKRKQAGKGRATTEDFVRPPDVEIYTLTDTGAFPNNQAFPVLVYRQALNPETEDLIQEVQRLFEQNHWGGSWVDGIYDYHHYHSTAHATSRLSRSGR